MTTQFNEEVQAVTNGAVSAPDRVREAVVEAARRLFAERGIHAVSVREIAREVGVSHTLLHLYFGNKEEIVRQVFQRYDGGFTEEVFAATDVDAAVGEVFRKVVQDPALVRVLGAALVEGIVPAPLDTKLQKALIQRLEGETGDVDPRIISVLVASMTLGWAVGSDWLLQEAGIPEDEREAAVDQAASVIERMIRGCI